MDSYLTTIKDIIIVIVPIVVAYISYRGNKKTQNDIRLEVERISKEKEAETKQILDKIGAELESQKQLMTWQNSIPQTNEYTNLAETKRFGNISALPKLTQDIYSFLNSAPSPELLVVLNHMLDRIELPSEEEELFPYEVPIILQYRILRKNLNNIIEDSKQDNKEGQGKQT